MTKFDKVIQQAEKTCLEQGARLTPKRRQVLATLLSQPHPLSAYEIAEIYQQESGESIPAMSVYRMLEFLMTHGFVHKLSSANKFIACSHITCDHQHQAPQFLICDNCHLVREVSIDSSLINALKRSFKDNHFQLDKPQLELHGLCENCQTS